MTAEDGTGRGQGHVTFSVEVRSDCAIGNEITNSASIVFDTEAPVVTNVWSNVCAHPPNPHHGDVDNSGEITPQDSLYALMIYLEMEAPPICDSIAADFCPQPDGDGFILPDDAYGILMTYLGIPDPC